MYLEKYYFKMAKNIWGNLTKLKRNEKLFIWSDGSENKSSSEKNLA